MTLIVTRAGKGSGLTNAEIDTNFTGLNAEKAPLNSPAFAGTVTGVTKAMVGLTSADDVSDVNKPVSTAQAAADTAALNSAKAYADGLVVGLWDDRGNYNASVNTFPAAGGSGAAGAVLKGDIWTVSVAGTVGGVPVMPRQTLRAMLDAPAQVAANWAIGLANTDLDDSITAGVTGRAPSQAAVFTALAGKAAINNVAPDTHAAAAKATPVDADELPLIDSAAAFALTRLTWANLKATLKSYFDAIYPTKTSGTGSLQLPAGTTAQRDGVPGFGATRANSTLNQTEWWNGTAWSPMGGGATGAPGNYAFVENDQTVTGDYTLTAGKNAMSAGPISINTGVAVTVPTGAVWSIV